MRRPSFSARALRGRALNVLTAAGVVCFLGWSGGCASSRSGETAYISPMGGGPVSEARAMDETAFNRALTQAENRVKAGEYSMVIPRLEQFTRQYPSMPGIAKAYYLLGVCYYRIGGYSAARDALAKYLELDPEGSYATEAQDTLDRMNRITPDTGKIPEELAKEIDRCRESVRANPEDMGARMALAEVLWNAGQYEEAGREYATLLNRWPYLMNDTVIRTRVKKEADGSFRVLTPEESEKIRRQDNPLVLYNIASFRSGRFENWSQSARERYYNVTGKAVNQGDKPLEDVRITVTIYGFGQLVYDTQTINMGTLAPGETRAFSAQFSRFDDINNVTRYECTGTFRR
ncbi:MAG TPA: tetratricopeptide repeat protein [Candidatus Hydrogenedentes bacterium]|nr:tetratricopeptide repeat protein [Candidatus Hydrogenedentota bacterium]